MPAEHDQLFHRLRVQGEDLDELLTHAMKRWSEEVFELTRRLEQLEAKLLAAQERGDDYERMWLKAQEREKALRETRDRLRFERDAARKREKALREKLAEWEKIGEEFESIANRDAETIARLLRRAGSPSEKPGSEPAVEEERDPDRRLYRKPLVTDAD